MRGFTRSKRNTKGEAKIMIFAKIESYRIHFVIIQTADDSDFDLLIKHNLVNGGDGSLLK